MIPADVEGLGQAFQQDIPAHDDGQGAEAAHRQGGESQGRGQGGERQGGDRPDARRGEQSEGRRGPALDQGQMGGADHVDHHRLGPQ